MNTIATHATYDELPYPSLAYADTHPNCLATLATLWGLTPPPVTTSRILELGCGDGTNLIAIAQTLPQAQCVGIDSSARQIAMGQELAKAISLTNLSLQQRDFKDLDDSLGTFDYIIAHGIYSWIPQESQDLLLSLCQRHLSPTGIVYISYNVFPGWHSENVIRDMMKYHLQQLPDQLPTELQLKQAKGILQFIAHLRVRGTTMFDVLLQEKWQQLQNVADNYLYHDFLEKDNHPVYFHQFVQQATQHQLAYVTDVEFRHYLLFTFPAAVVEALEELFQDDLLKREQYLDFFYHRTLRRSLLCQAHLPISRHLHPHVLQDCYLATPTRSPDEMVSFTHPWTQSALAYLTQIYPHSLSFTELCHFLQTQLSLTDSQLSEGRNSFVAEVFQLYCQEVLEVSLLPPVFMTTPNSRPLASPLARWQATQGKVPLINLRGEYIDLNPICVQLLPFLNGKNDRKLLVTKLTQILKKMQIRPPSGKIDYPTLLEEALEEIAKGAFLMAAV